MRGRTSKFRLKTMGWGNFTLYCKVVHKDGSVLNLAHELELRYPDGRLTEN